MRQFEAAREYFSAAELAALALPGLSRSKRKVNARALRENWLGKRDFSDRPMARRRDKKGGGFEYHWHVLPAEARAELIRRGLVPVVGGAPSGDSRFSRDEDAGLITRNPPPSPRVRIEERREDSSWITGGAPSRWRFRVSETGVDDTGTGFINPEAARAAARAKVHELRSVRQRHVADLLEFREKIAEDDPKQVLAFADRLAALILGDGYRDSRHVANQLIGGDDV